MNGPTLIYQVATSLLPDKFPVVDELTEEVGETDQMRAARQAALERSHEIRKFEIELYWKRATHFWVLQAAVFAAVGLTWKFSDLDISPVMPVVLAALGFTTAVAGWLSARGSKFWQENWEHHIDMLEDEFEGRLHKTAYVGKDGIAWSVSGVNDRLALCFVGFWSAILLSTAFRANPGWLTLFPGCLNLPWGNTGQTMLIFAAMIWACAALWCRKTDFADAEGISYKAGTASISREEVLSKFQPVAGFRKSARPFLVVRKPKT